MGKSKKERCDELLAFFFENENVTSKRLVELMSVDDAFDIVVVAELMMELLRRKSVAGISFLLDEETVESFIIFCRKTFVSNYFFNMVIEAEEDIVKFYGFVEKENYKVAWRPPHSGTMNYDIAQDKIAVKNYESEFFKHYAQGGGFTLYSGYTVLETAISYVIKNCVVKEESRFWIEIMKKSEFKTFSENTDIVGNILAVIKMNMRKDTKSDESAFAAILSDAELTARVFKTGDSILLKYCDVEDAMKRAPNFFI